VRALIFNLLMNKRHLIAGTSGLASAALALRWLTRPKDVEWRKHARLVRHADRSQFIEIDEIKVHYQEIGPTDGKPLLLIHGFCASTIVWSEIFLPLKEQGFRVIAPDLMGFGFSDKPSLKDYTIESHAQLIIQLMDRLKLDKATLVGSSYGGAVAATCALDYPERVERLVMVGAVTNNEAKRQLLLRVGAIPVVGDIVVPFLVDMRWLMMWRSRKLYAKQNAHLVTKERWALRNLHLRTMNTQRAALRTLRSWDAERVERDAHKINHPTLLIWGEEDRDIPLRHGENLHQHLPNSRLIVFRNCGHLPQEEYPGEFSSLITEFCNDNTTQ
jgi:pimeloyl-ACP methyl ester carboxylesterase